MSIKVIIQGAAGRMGKTLIRCIQEQKVAGLELVGAIGTDTFLYDPHGIRYTGALRILLGWLSNLHMVTTVYYQDFIHTEDGVPVMAFLEDNYEDVRSRFPKQMEQFRRLLWNDPMHPVTIVVDRAIYDVQRLREYRRSGIFVITWLKGGGDVHPAAHDRRGGCLPSGPRDVDQSDCIARRHP